MTKPCVVPQCKTGSRKVKKKVSVFKVPSNSERFKKWQSAIPNKVLTSSHYVCEKHFEEESILRKYISHDAFGKVIAEVIYKHPRLKESAVPTIFEETKDIKPIKKTNANEVPLDVCSSETECPVPYFDTHLDHTYFKKIDNIQFNKSIRPGRSKGNLKVTYKHPRLKKTTNPTKFEELKDIKPVKKTDANNVPLDPCSSETARAHSSSSETAIAHGSGSTDNIGTRATKVLMIKKSSNGTSPFHQVAANVKLDTSPVTINGNTSKTVVGDGVDCIASPPMPWVAGRLSSSPHHRLVFLYPEMTKKDDIEIPITIKAVTVDREKNVRYFVHGNLVEDDDVNLPRKLDALSDLYNILIKFANLTMCCGMGEINVNFVPAEETFKDYADRWHHKQCSLLWKKRRCDKCSKLRKCVLQRAKRIENQHSRYRISRLSNPIDDHKLELIKKRIKCERRGRSRVKCQLLTVQNSFKAQQLEIAAIKEGTLEQRCSELLVPAAQKTAMKAIIAAASTRNAKGRRYSEDWIMMCMLMNIRSPAYYEFLRKKNVMPLPSKRTIRSYFSILNTNSGFDNKFSHLLKKHFDGKTPMQRHGLLLIEINLKKSEAVDDGPQSSNLKEQATHRLVMMFQPLDDECSKPIVVFASKNSVKGEELTNLLVKAIVYLENCGANIHGVITNAVKTSQKMWSLLDVRGSISETKSWFTHPVDNERKVFVFVDVPRVFLNIRNRLYNKGRLRTSPDTQYIEWKFFEILYEIDTQYVANSRACPKLSKGHIDLDNTSKMRVRLATQIFSNSVAQALTYYASQNCGALADCDETIYFCKRLNDTFDALNRKTPNEGLTPQSPDFKVLEDTLQWLNDWQSAVLSETLSPEEFLTENTSTSLRLTLRSTIDMCVYLISKFNFKYLLTSKLHQDNLE